MNTPTTAKQPNQYKHYENHETNEKGIIARMVERLEVTNKYNKIKRGIIKLRQFNVVSKT